MVIKDKIRQIANERKELRWEIIDNSDPFYRKVFTAPTILPTILAPGIKREYYMLSDETKVYRPIPKYGKEAKRVSSYEARAERLNKYLEPRNHPRGGRGLRGMLAYEQDIGAIAGFMKENPKKFAENVNFGKLFNVFFHHNDIEDFVGCVSSDTWREFAVSIDYNILTYFTDSLHVNYRSFCNEMKEQHGDEILGLFPVKNRYQRE